MEPVLLLLPDELLAELSSVAGLRGLDAGVLARQLLAAELPGLLAEALAEPIDAEPVDDELHQDASDPEVRRLRAAQTIAALQRIDHGQSS